jgi:hypothetical protein
MDEHRDKVLQMGGLPKYFFRDIVLQVNMHPRKRYSKYKVPEQRSGFCLIEEHSVNGAE